MRVVSLVKNIAVGGSVVFLLLSGCGGSENNSDEENGANAGSSVAVDTLEDCPILFIVEKDITTQIDGTPYPKFDITARNQTDFPITAWHAEFEFYNSAGERVGWLNVPSSSSDWDIGIPPGGSQLCSGSHENILLNISSHSEYSEIRANLELCIVSGPAGDQLFEDIQAPIDER